MREDIAAVFWLAASICVGKAIFMLGDFFGWLYIGIVLFLVSKGLYCLSKEEEGENDEK